MSTTVEERLSQLEDQTRRLHDRLERVEAWVNVPAPRAAPQVAAPGPTRVRSAPTVEPTSRPEPLSEQGWQIVDEFNRAFAGKPASGYVAPVHITTVDNSHGATAWDPPGYREAYRKIWGM